MAPPLDINGQENPNVFARQRDAMILWLLQRHPATAGMLAGIGLFPDAKKAGKRLRRLVQKKLVRHLGTISLKDGRPEYVFCRGRWKTDNLFHEVQLTRLLLKIHAQDVRRGWGEVDQHLRPDAELWINGEHYFVEMDCGTMCVPEVSKRFAKYASYRDLVLWICPTESRMEGLRKHAEMIRDSALFTTLAAAIVNPHAPIWVDFNGERAALPGGVRGGITPGQMVGRKLGL